MKRHNFLELFDQLFTSHSEYSLEERLFQSSLVIGILAGIVGTIIGTILSLSLALLIAGVLFIFFQHILLYLVRRNHTIKPYIIPLLALYLISFIILWFYGGGIESQNIILASVLLILSLAIVPENRAKYVITIFILLVLIFYLVQYFYPSAVVPYKSSANRWFDALSTTIYSSFFIFLIVRYILKNFNLERTKAEQRGSELQRMNVNKDRFLSVLSHDLKGPFSSLLGLSSILKRKVYEMDRESIEEYVRMIDDSANQAYRLLDDLLIWSSSQQGKIDVIKEQIQVSELFSSSILTVASGAEAKSVTIIRDAEPGMVVSADPDMIKTIIRNLVSNAVKFSYRGGTVTLKAEKTSGNVIFSVIDNGTGLNKQTRANLFDITNFHSTKGTEQEPGTGLGLLICKDFIEKHGGTIWVDSEDGKGSAFQFTIPD